MRDQRSHSAFLIALLGRPTISAWRMSVDPNQAPGYFSPRTMGPLRKGPTALTKTMGQVQAAPTVQETEYMLGLADATDFVATRRGLGEDFENPEDLKHLKRFAKHQKFSGVAADDPGHS